MEIEQADVENLADEGVTIGEAARVCENYQDVLAELRRRVAALTGEPVDDDE